LKILNDFKKELIKNTADITKLPVIINKINSPVEEIKFLSGKQMIIINKMLLKLNSKKIFDIFSLIKTDSYIFASRLDPEIELKYLRECEKNQFITKDVAKLMVRHYDLDKAINICVDNDYLDVIEFIEMESIIWPTAEKFEKIFEALNRTPGYHKIKSYILCRSDLNQEQRVYGLKSLIRKNHNLPSRYDVSKEDLRGLPFGMALELLEMIRGYNKLELSREVTIKDIEVFLFPLMIKDFRKYEALVNPIKNRIRNRISSGV